MTTSPTFGSKRVYGAIESREWNALLLTGGSDIDPRRYGEKKISKHVYGINQVRDRVEDLALNVARERNLPVLGICRGHQMINVESGGTLDQHIGRRHRGMDHPVVAEEGSLLERISGDTFVVISLHHQEVLKPGLGMKITGRALDGTVEAIESEDGRVLGVQFHPEMDGRRPYSQGIFRWLIEEAAIRSGLPVPPIPEPLPEPVKEPIRLGWSGEDYDYPSFDDLMWGESNLEELPTTPGGMVAAIEAAAESSKSMALVKARPQRRQAGTRTFRRPAPVQVSWFCPKCGIKFDKQEDRNAHVEVLHREPVADVATATVESEAT